MHALTLLSRFCLLALLLISSGMSRAADVVMAFGEKIPPFCFPESDSGIELEIIGEALAFRGHKLKPRYYPLARVPLTFRKGEVDAAMTDLGQDLSDVGAHYGDPAVIYQNVFVTLQNRNLKIETPQDLKGLSVVAFQGAAKRYPEWLAASEKAGLYFEQNNQELQVLGLNKARYDVVLSDRRSFVTSSYCWSEPHYSRPSRYKCIPSPRQTPTTTARYSMTSRSAMTSISV